MAIDPFAVGDPFSSADPFGGGGGSRRRRAAAYPPLSPQEADSAIGGLANAGLSTLGYVGGTLDKLFGGRAIRGVLGGNAREALSLIPGSDVAGLTDPTQVVSGRDLLEKAGVLGPNQDGLDWGDGLGFVADVALDPSTYLGGIGALSKSGQAAKKAGTLSKGLLVGVRNGERSLHPLVSLAAKVGVPNAQAGAVDLLQSAGKGLGSLAGKVNDAALKLPGVGTRLGAVEDFAKTAGDTGYRGLRSMFDRKAGNSIDPTVQAAHEFTKLPVKEGLEQDALGGYFDLAQRQKAILDRGVPESEFNRLLRQRVEGVDPGPQSAAILPHVGDIEALAQDAIARKQAAFALKQDRGANAAELQDAFAEHFFRQAFDANKKAGSGRELMFGTRDPSRIRRLGGLRDVPGATIGIEDLATPELAGVARTLSDRAVRQKLYGDRLAALGVNREGLPLPVAGAPVEGPAINPGVLATQRKGAVDTSRLLKALDKKHISGGPDPRVPIFQPDVLRDMAAYELFAGNAVSNMDAVYDVARRGHRLATGAPTDVPVTSMLHSAGLQGEKARTLAAQAVGLDPANVLARAQANLKPNQVFDPVAVLGDALAPYKVPAGAAKGATKLINGYQTPEALVPFLRAADTMMNAFKTGTYTAFPSPIVRNLGTAVFNNALDGVSAPSHYLDANALMKGNPIVSGIQGMSPLTPEAQALALQREMFVNKVIGAPQGILGERVGGGALSPLGTGNPSAPRPGVRTIAAKAFQGVPDAEGGIGKAVAAGKGWLDTSRGVSNAVEDNVRAAQFLGLRRKGFTPEAAAQSVRDTHFDYANGLTDFERNVMRRIVPFYTFSRFNVPRQLRLAAERPATMQTPIRAAEMFQGGAYVPEYLNNGLAIPAGGKDEQGNQRFVTSLGLPMEEAMQKLRIGTNPVDTLKKSVAGLIGQVRPELRVPLEFASGKQFHTGRDLADLDPGKVASLGGLLSDEAAQPIAQILSGTPATRAISTFNRMIDERKGLPTKALSLLSGAKLTDVDSEKWRAIDARHRLEALLSSQEGVRKSTDYYVKPEERPLVSPQAAFQLELYAAMKKKARDVAEQKRKVGVRIGP